MTGGPGTGGDARFPAPDELVERILADSRGEACMAVVEEQSEVEVRFANNTTTTNGLRRRRRVTAISYKAVAGGIAAGMDSRSGSPDIADLLRASEAAAEGSPPADDAMPLLAGSPGRRPAAFEDSGRFGEGPAVTELSVLRPVVEGLPAAFDRARSRGHVLAGFATHQLSTVYLGSSTGLRARHEQPTGTVELVARSADGSRSTWAGSGTSWFDDVDLASMHERLEHRLGWAERRVELPEGRYETILPPDATADLMIFLYDFLSGRDAEDGRSVFSAPGGRTRLGETIASSPFELRSDPDEPGLECAPFLVTTASATDVSVFDNGLPLERTTWISQGRLDRLLYHRAAASRSAVPVAAPIDNLVLELPGAAGSVEDLVSGSDRALLLTCLWYIRTLDPVTALLTGLTRDGVYLVEKGEVVGAVNNFRFNESPVHLLSRVMEAGTAARALSRESGEWLSRTAMPPLRVADFNMSSVSRAT